MTATEREYRAAIAGAKALDREEGSITPPAVEFDRIIRRLFSRYGSVAEVVAAYSRAEGQD